MTLCATSRAANPCDVLVGLMPRLVCVTLSRSRKSAQLMRATIIANQVLLTQALVTRNGLRGFASSSVNRFVSNAGRLSLSVGASLIVGQADIVVATVLSGSVLSRLNARELTHGGLRVRFFFMMRNASSAVGVVTTLLSSDFTVRLQGLCKRFLDVALLR